MFQFGVEDDLSNRLRDTKLATGTVAEQRRLIEGRVSLSRLEKMRSSPGSSHSPSPATSPVPASHCEERILQLETELASSNAELHKLATELSAVRDDAKANESERRSSLRSVIEQLQAQLAEALEAKGFAEHEVTRLNKTISGLETDRACLADSQVQAARESVTKDAELRHLQPLRLSNSELTAQIQSLNCNIEHLQSEVDSRTIEMNANNELKIIMEQRIQDLESELMLKEDSLKLVRATLLESEIRAKHSLDKAVQLHAISDQSESTNKELQQKMIESQRECAYWQAVCSRSQASERFDNDLSLAAMQKQHNKEMTECNERLTLSLQRVEELEYAQQSLETEVETICSDNAVLQTKLEAFESKLRVHEGPVGSIAKDGISPISIDSRRLARHEVSSYLSFSPRSPQSARPKSPSPKQLRISESHRYERHMPNARPHTPRSSIALRVPQFSGPMSRPTSQGPKPAFGPASLVRSSTPPMLLRAALPLTYVHTTCISPSVSPAPCGQVFCRA